MAFEIIDANTIFGPWPQMRADMPADRLVTALQNHGVAKSLAVSTVGILHNAGDGNAETARVCAEREMLIPVATIDPRGYFGSASLIPTLLEQGFRMIRFFPVLQDWDLDHAAFCDVLDALDQVSVPVMVQAKNTGRPTALARVTEGKSNIFIMEGVSFENMAEAVAVMKKRDNLMIETRELRVPGALRFLVDQVGADRVVFGSGCLRSSLAAALGYITDSDVSDENKEKILGGNIKRLLGG